MEEEEERRVRGRGASAWGGSTTAGLSGSGRGVNGHRTTKAIAVGQWSPRTEKRRSI